MHFHFIIALLKFFVIIAYIWGVWKFWTGFGLTHFEPNFLNKVRLTLFWPFFLIASSSYRRNFSKALRGR